MISNACFDPRHHRPTANHPIEVRLGEGIAREGPLSHKRPPTGLPTVYCDLSRLPFASSFRKSSTKR
jgi:hypothetical protein